MNTASPITEAPGSRAAPVLTRKDAQILHETLVQGDQALARRKDLGDMFKRIVSMLTTLDTGLSDRQKTRADEDRALLTDRLDRLERSINGIEGVLRIEMEMMIHRSIEQSGAGRKASGPASGKTTLGWRMIQLATLGLCVAGGAIFSDEINNYGRALQAATFWSNVGSGAQQSPNGGSADTGNQVN